MKPIVLVVLPLKFTQMPPAASAQEDTARSSDEGNAIVSAQNKVYDMFRHEKRLTMDEMDALFQEAMDNHWE